MFVTELIVATVAEGAKVAVRICKAFLYTVNTELLVAETDAVKTWFVEVADSVKARVALKKKIVAEGVG